jgi:hypothetical protein
MNKLLVVAVVVAGALFYITTTDDQADARNPGDTAWESRVEQVDTYLSEGLSEDTHQTIAKPARQSADVAINFGNSLTAVVE